MVTADRDNSHLKFISSIYDAAYEFEVAVIINQYLYEGKSRNP